MLTAKHIELLEARGLEVELLSQMGWFSAENPGAGDGFIGIPYFRDGKKVGCKYRTLSGEKKFYQEKGSEQCLYNLDALKHISETTPIYIHEGEMDAVVSMQFGNVAVSVPNGAPSKEIESEDSTKFDYLKDIPSKNPIVLAVDSDKAGVVLMNELVQRLGRGRCQWIRYPKDCKDLNDALIKYGEKGVKESLKTAKWFALDGVYRMSEIPPEPEFEAYDTKVEGLADYFRIRQGDLTVITGHAGDGKTTLINEVMCNMVKFYGWHVCVASFEQSPKPDHLRYLRTYFNHRPPRLYPDNSPEIIAADEWIEKNFSFVFPRIETKDFIDFNWVFNRITDAITRDNAKLIVIDPWNEMEHEPPGGQSLTQYVGSSIRQMKRYAREHQVHIVVIAHPAKMKASLDGKEVMPRLHDISDSSHWANKPDIGMIMYRNEYDLNVLRVQKCRYEGTIGSRGQVTLKYDSYRGVFEYLNKEAIEAHIEKVKANRDNATGKTKKTYTKKPKKLEVAESTVLD